MTDSRIVAPPRHAAAWAAALAAREIPVLASTAEMIEAMRANEDAFDANAIGEALAADPMMALKVLVHETALRGSRDGASRVRTVTAALVMLGISPFFRAFGPQPAVEDSLADRPDALGGFRRCLARARRGAEIALAFAVHRVDPDAGALHGVVLLHEAAQMLTWCHAPDLALAVDRALADEPGLRSAAAQTRVLHATYDDVQGELAAHWKLPLLIDHRGTQPPQPSDHIVELAVRLARHAGLPWDHPALVDDVADAAGFLNLSTAATLRLVQDL